MNADQGELDAMILDQLSWMTMSTEPLLEVEMVEFLKMEVPSLRTGVTLQWMGSQLTIGMTVTGCIVNGRSQEVNYFMIRCICSMRLRSGLSRRKNHSRWLFPTQAHMMSSASPRGCP